MFLRIQIEYSYIYKNFSRDLYYMPEVVMDNDDALQYLSSNKVADVGDFSDLFIGNRVRCIIVGHIVEDASTSRNLVIGLWDKNITIQ